MGNIQVRLVFTLVGVVLSLAYPISGQRTKVDDSLQLKVKIATRAVCLNRPLLVTAVIRNVSEADIIIDPAQIGYSTSFIWVGNYRGGSAGTSLDVIAHGIGSSFITLRPGQEFSERLRLDLDKSFFRAGRKYGFQIAYGQFKFQSFQGLAVWRGSVESNEVEFWLRSCKRTR